MLINPYKLPTASEERLGGIKAAEKTTETVEVKIDTATGKLYVPDSQSSGEVNIIEEVQLNGTPLTITDKSVNVTVPTDVSDLTDTTNIIPTDVSQLADTTGLLGEDNVIEGVKVGGTSLTPASKIVNITFLPTTTTAPTAAWTGGGHKIVILSSEPTTKYAGWIYLIEEVV